MSSEYPFQALAVVVTDELYWWAHDAASKKDMKDQLPTWQRILGIVQQEAERYGVTLVNYRVPESSELCSDEAYLSFLRSLASRVVNESLSEARRLRHRNDPSALATLRAWAHAVTCMQVQADMLGVPLRKIGLDRIDPDNDIMGVS